MCRLIFCCVVVFSLCLTLSLASTLNQGKSSSKPNILFILLDDLGYNNVGYHAKGQENEKEIQTPNIDALATEGIILDNHYAFPLCSPSRCSLQTGRSAIHVNVVNDFLGDVNPEDPIAGFAGIPRNMTTIAEKMKSGGYRTYFSGKWHAGLATPEHIPSGRGYDKSLCYLGASNDYFTYKVRDFEPSGGYCESDVKYNDIWMNNEPASDISRKGNGTIYEEDIFTKFVKDSFESYAEEKNRNKTGNKTDDPFFMFWAPHSVHKPYEVKLETLNKFRYIENEDRRLMAAMVHYIDEKIGSVINQLKKLDLYENTLIVFTSDNGGAIDMQDAANNYPLRGGKMSNFEGGIRVNTFVSGGNKIIPDSRRGIIINNQISGLEDWYATFCFLARVDPLDYKAILSNKEVQAASNSKFQKEKMSMSLLPEIDSVNLWPLLINDQPVKDEIVLATTFQNTSKPRESSLYFWGSTLVQGLIDQEGYKILVGNITHDMTTSALYPNITFREEVRTGKEVEPDQHILNCGNRFYPYENACLFNIFDDPQEGVNLALDKSKKHQTILKKLKKRLEELQDGSFSPNRGNNKNSQTTSCVIGAEKYNYFLGPFIDL